MEEESWGVLTEEEFDNFLDIFTKRFGKPVNSRRLSFSFWDHNRNSVDTRIRITDGKPEIMQKIGHWEGTQAWSRKEQSIRLQPNIDDIFGTYQVLRVLIPGKDDCYIYQYDNYIFKQTDFEIKLTHQSGKTDKYNFEVEALVKNVDLSKILKDLGLSEKVTTTNTEFWDKWNAELNFKDNDLTESQIKDLIQKYLR